MDQISTYENVYNELLVRVNDPDGDTYTGRAKELVYEGIVSLAVSGKFEADQIPSLVTTKLFQGSSLTNSRLKVSGVNNDFYNFNIIKIIGITDDIIDQGSNVAPMKGMSYFSDDITPTLTPFYHQDTQDVARQKYIPISLSEVNRLNDPEEQPFFDEIYYYRRNEHIYFFPWQNMTNMAFVIHYLKSPPNFDTSDIMTEKFSLDFLYKVIDYGVGRIREEQAGQ